MCNIVMMFVTYCISISSMFAGKSDFTGVPITLFFLANFYMAFQTGQNYIDKNAISSSCHDEQTRLSCSTILSFIVLSNRQNHHTQENHSGQTLPHQTSRHYLSSYVLLIIKLLVIYLIRIYILLWYFR